MVGGGREKRGGERITRRSTHISLGNLLSFAGVCQGAHTQVRDGDSRAGSKCDQHQENPKAAVQWQLQAIGLLEWEGRDVHFTPGEVTGSGESD